MAIKSNHLAAGEKEVLTLRTHPKVLVVPVLISIVIMVGGMALAWLASESPQRGLLWAVIGGVAFLGLVRFLAYPLLRWHSETYSFTNQRLMMRTGIISQETRNIPLFRINDIQMRKDFVDRLFGCGTLIVSDATDKPGLELYDIPNVEEVHVKVQNLLFRADDGTDDGANPPGEPPRD